MSRPLRDPVLEQRLRDIEEAARKIHRQAETVEGRVNAVTQTINDSADGVITIEIEDEDSLVVHVDDVRTNARGRA